MQKNKGACSHISNMLVLKEIELYSMAHTLQFCGGAGTVTGACYLLEANGKKLLVDCGMFQGGRFAEKENEKPFPFDPASIDIVFVTHAHADHIGRLPKLVKNGFRGPIICTPPTRDLMRVMLTDALKIMKHECEFLGEPLLYDERDLESTLALTEPHRYNEPLDIGSAITITLRDSAHILGSCMIEMTIDEMIVVFTGDIGNTPAPLLKDVYPIPMCDYLIMESVYGNRIHEYNADRKALFERAIEDTVTKKGTLVIPILALERTQGILSELDELIEHNRVPRIPMFLDSPLAIDATKVYKTYSSYFNADIQKLIEGGNDLFAFPGLTLAHSREESQKINDVPPPKLIMAGNPHGYGSRISHHFLRMLPDPNSTVLFVGYPRISSIGRALVDGARSVKIWNSTVPVRAQIKTISGYSAHADADQLTAFVARIQKPIKTVFVAMGEPDSAQGLAQRLADEVGVVAQVPKLFDVVQLT